MAVTRDSIPAYEPSGARAPLVSIVTPTYNRAGFLRETMASIRSQTYSDIEHIVVDGASTDDTQEVLRAAEGSYRLRWVSEPDDGMYQAINKGLRMAQGQILAYLNSDDLYFPWTVQTIVDAFARRPDAGFVYGDAIAIEDASGRAEPYWFPPFDLDFIRRTGLLAQPTVFWTRAAYERLGPFDERLRFVADCDYWMRAGKQHAFVKVDEFLAVERDHSDTIREALSADIWPELQAVRERYVQLDGTTQRWQARRHRIRVRWYFTRNRVAFLLQSLLPRSIRRSAWRNLLDSRSFEIHRLSLLAWLMPRVGRRFADRVLGPSRYWLEPSHHAPPGEEDPFG